MFFTSNRINIFVLNIISKISNIICEITLKIKNINRKGKIINLNKFKKISNIFRKKVNQKINKFCKFIR